eukprot:3299158-Rhodomonas_salina.1
MSVPDIAQLSTIHHICTEHDTPCQYRTWRSAHVTRYEHDTPRQYRTSRSGAYHEHDTLCQYRASRSGA